MSIYDERIAKLKKQQSEQPVTKTAATGSLYDERIAQMKATQTAGGSKKTQNVRTFASDYLESKKRTEDNRAEYLAERQAYRTRHGDKINLLQFDLDAGQKEIDDLEKELRQLKTTGVQSNFGVNSRPYSVGQQEAPEATYTTGYGIVNNQPYAVGMQSKQEVTPGDNRIRELEQQISQKKQYLNQAKQYQEKIAYEDTVKNEDFDQYDDYVESDDDLYNWINDKQFRDSYEASYQSAPNPNARRSKYVRKGYDRMTENEVAIYNYIYARGGKKAGQNYLDTIQEDLNARIADDMYGRIKDDTALELVFGVTAGLNQFGSNVNNLFNTKDDYIAQTAYQVASGKVRADLADDGTKLPDWLGGASVGQIAYDAIQTTANMAPSILASYAVGLLNPTAGQAIGNAMMGASAAGSAYQQALNEGFDKDQARGYSVLVGASEMVMEKVLGGISAVGGNAASKAITRNVANADNVLKAIVKKVPASMFSEFSEEYLQEVLDPVFRNIMLGTNEEVKLVSAEAIYSGILGALTAFAMEGPSVVAGEVGTYRTGMKLQDAKVDQRLAQIGSTFAADTVAYQLAGKVNENTNAYTIGRLFNEIGATLTDQNVGEITEALIAKGMGEITAKKNAQALARVIEGENLTDQQIAMIEANDVLAEVARTTLIDANTTINQRTRGYHDILRELANKKYGVTQTSATADSVGASMENAQTKDSTERAAAADMGTRADTEETASVKEITTLKNGVMKLRMNDGTEVESGDVSYSSRGEALLYETIAQMTNDVQIANLLVNGFHNLKKNSALDAEVYAAGIEEAFRFGKGNIPRKELANSEFASKLSAAKQDYAYRMGQKAAGKQAAREQASVSKKESAEKTPATGKVHFDRKGRTFDKTREASLKTMEQLSKALGVEFYVYESYVNKDGQRVYRTADGKEASAPNGFYDPKTGAIHIDLNAGADGNGTMIFTVAHELTHFIKQWSSAKFKVLANFLVEQYGEKNVSVSELVQQQMDKAKRNGRNLTWDEAYEEMVADSMEAMLTDGNVVQMMADLKQQDKTLWQKICDWFKNLADDLKELVEAYKGYKPDSPEGKMVADMQDTIVILESIYADALTEASEHFQKAEKNTTEDGGVKNSIRDKFYEQVNNWDGRTIGFSFVVGDTSNALQEAGIPQKQIRWDASKIATLLKKHNGMTLETVKQIPELLENPIIVIDSKKDDNSKIVMGDLYDEHGKIVTAVLLLTPTSKKGNMLDFYKISSAEGRSHIKSLFTKEDGSPVAVRYVDKKRIQSWLNVNRLQLPLHNLDSDSKFSIRNDGDNVNKKFSDRDYMDAVNRGDMRTAQRMVDEAAKQWGAFLNNDEANEIFKQSGEVRTFYHGTNTGDFTVFDKSLLGNSSGDMGWFGKGFYFAFSSREAATYGGRVINAYLKMRKPYDYSQLYKFKGSDYVSDKYSRLAWLYNIVKQFPDIVSGQKVYAYPNDAEDGAAVSWKQLAGWMDRIEQKAKFSVEQVETPYGDIAWELRANPKEESFTNDDGETFTWTEYGMRQMFTNERDAKEPINQIGAYLSNVMGVETIPRRSIEKIDFSGAVQRAGYDGIIQSPSGDEAVVFDSSQIKSSDPVTYDDNGNVIPLSKRFDRSNPDIRYSDRDPAAGRVNQVLQSENAKLKEDVQYLKDLVKLQKTVTGGTKFTKTSVEAMAGNLMKANNVKGNKQELAKLLNGLYEYIAKGEELSWDGVKEMAQPAVDWLRKNTVIKSELSQYAREILHDVRTSRISLDESQIAEAAYRFGSYNDYRKAMMGSIVVSKDGVPLYIQWQEWSNMYPDIFDANTTASDMPGALADAISSLRNSDLSRAEYAYHADMIEQDLLQQVYDGYWRVSTLYTVADIKQREIGALKFKHRQQMNDLRQFHREKTDQLKREHRDEVKRIRNEYREDSQKKQQEIIQRYQDSRTRSIENRNKTAMRHKIQNVVKELNSLLLTNDKKRRVPDNLKKSVADALDLLNTDTVDAENRAAKYANLIAQEQAKANPDQDKIDAYTVSMENILRQGEKMGQRIKELKNAYEEIQSSDDPDIANAYDPVIAGAISELAETIGNTSLKNMSMEQLSDVYDVYRMVLNRVRDANKAMAENIKESISKLAKDATGEVRMVGGSHKSRVAALDQVSKFDWNNLKPVYAMERIGSSTMTKLFDNVRAGEDTWAKDVSEAREYYLEKSKKYGYDKWDFDKKYRFESNSGIPFDLTLEQILSLYAYSKREQAADHLRLGGFVFDSNIETYEEKDGKKSLLKYKVNTADAHQITPEIMADIIGKLTKEQALFVDEMQDYLSAVMGAKGNEVTSKMYGVKLFKEKFYFPLKSAKQYMFEQNQVAGEVRIKNSGFTNKVVAKANNPVILSNFMDVWSGHVNDMSMYHAFTLPLEDFNRVFNFNTPKKDGMEPVSVKGTIQNAYGPAAVEYLKQLITDLNGGARTDSRTGFINKAMGRFKKGAVFASLSVVVQQPSAIARAAALIDTTYFIGPRVDQKRHKYLWEEVKKYAPVAIIKEMGYFDTNMGKSTQDFITGKEYSGIKEKAKAVVTDSAYRDELLSKAPALADEYAWCGIWAAVKRETKAKYPNMDTTSEAFLKLAGKRFTEVITKTQVYDSVLARSANMRSKDTGMKMATAFMAEPTTSINMIEDAILKGRRGNRKYARNAIGAVIASQILNSILVSFVYAGRDDDEDETYAEKYVGALTGSLVDGINPATYIPFIKDIVSIVQGYDVERSDMAVISDIWKAIQNLKNENLSPYRKVENFVGSIAQIFGLPVKNIMRDVRGVYNTIMTLAGADKTTGAGVKYAIGGAITGKTVSNKEQLYEARLAGDEQHAARVAARYDDEDSADAAVRAAIKDSFMADDIDEATALKHMVLYAGMDASEAHWTMDAWKYRKTVGSDEGYGKYEKFYDAIRSGNNLSVVIKEYTDNGVKTSTLTGAITDEFKPVYLEASDSEKKSMKTRLINAYVQCEMDREDAEGKLESWDFEAEYGFAYSDRKDTYLSGKVSKEKLIDILIDHGYEEENAEAQIEAYEWERDGFEDVTASAIRSYNEWCEPAGIPKSVYLAFWKYDNSTENDVDPNTGKKIAYSAVRKIMAYIDSLDLTNAQKDALAKSAGWADKTIQKYKLW